METRKLQQVGGGTYTISIPKQWAAEQSLEAGEKLHLYTHTDGSVVVRSSERDGGVLQSTHVAVDGDDPKLARRALRAAHAIGFESVTLASTDSFTDEQRRAVRSLVKSLVGTETVAERDDEITIRHLLDASDVSIRQSVVQLQFITLSIHRRATTAFVEAQAGEYDHVRERAEETDRLAEMVTRHFNRSLISIGEVDQLGVTRPALFDYYTTARLLGRVVDEGVTIARHADRLSGPLADEVADDVREVAESARRVVDDAVTANLEGTGVGDGHEVLDAHDETLTRIDSLERTAFDSSGIDGRALVRVLDSLRRTTDAGGRIAQSAIGADTRP